jgi:8-oxo-dGTP pyrophosphatase MutT (NUDIX family)
MKMCAGAFVYRDGHVLLGLRSQTRSSYPGVWDAIGGHAEPTESPREALVRELEEEIQITPTAFRELATLVEPRPDINGDAVYHLFVVTKWSGVGPLARGDEHSDIRWFRIEEAVRLNLAHPGYADLLRSL